MTKINDKEFDFHGEDTSYLSHSMHPYPAKFPPQLPKRILHKYAKKGDIVLDPFCGSGTTLVEARIYGANAIGVDVNGLSTLLSKVKATPLAKNQFKIINNFVNKIYVDIEKWEYDKRPKPVIKQIEGSNHWFQENVTEELSYLISEIEKEKDEDVIDFLKIALSSIIVKVSNQDSDTRFAAISKNIPNGLTLKLFCKKANEYSIRMVEFSNQITDNTELKIYNADSRDLSFIKNNSIDIIITSPPYANTYDYYLYHKFRKRWLNIDVKFAQYNEIGSRREFSSLKEQPKKWYDDLIKCFKEMAAKLKPSKYAFLVIGDSVIKKELIKIEKVITAFAPTTGFKVTDILSTDLSHHSKLFNPNYAQKGKQEHLITLQKVI